MGAFIESASSVLAQSFARVDVSAHNLANISTSGYKRQTPFVAILAAGGAPTVETSVSFDAGKLTETRNPTDLALSGPGFFVLSDGAQRFYTRDGQFHLDAQGRLLSSTGFVLQAEGGGDVVVDGQDFTVLPNAVVSVGGETRQRIAIVEAADPSMLRLTAGGVFEAPADAEIRAPLEFSVRQGALEAPNVSTGDEMVAIMEAVRRAEAGQRLINVYDDLLGRALNTFGQSQP